MKVLILKSNQPAVHRSWGEENIEKKVIAALQEGGCEVHLENANNDKQADKVIQKIKPDIVFPNCYWILQKKDTVNENSIYICEYLEKISMPYVGSSSEVLKQCLPKASFKQILKNLNLPTPDFVIANDINFTLNKMSFPVITKLNYGAESIGVFKINDEISLHKKVNKLLKQYNQSVIIEQWLNAREYTVGILGNSPDRFIMPLEIKIPKGFLYMEHFLKSNRMLDSIQSVTDPQIKLKIEEFMQNVTTQLKIRDWARFDILEKNGELFIIDLNFLPGLRKNGHISYFPLCTENNLNLNYTQTVNSILYSAIIRYQFEPPSQMQDLLSIKNAYNPN